ISGSGRNDLLRGVFTIRIRRAEIMYNLTYLVRTSDTQRTNDWKFIANIYPRQCLAHEIYHCIERKTCPHGELNWITICQLHNRRDILIVKPFSKRLVDAIQE